jgi:lipoprotein-anchoring transpeptidase ErfK/SrfK
VGLAPVGQRPVTFTLIVRESRVHVGEAPLGEFDRPRALTLSGGEGYAIHGTSRPRSIGTFASYGCIRMFNEDILDLFERVKVGTEVLVTL